MMLFGNALFVSVQTLIILEIISLIGAAWIISCRFPLAETMPMYLEKNLSFDMHMEAMESASVPTEPCVTSAPIIKVGELIKPFADACPCAIHVEPPSLAFTF